MNTWSPLWSKIVDSSIWMEDKNTKILFVTMLALKDRDHVVRYSAFELSRRANLTEKEVIEALSVLQSPDTKRIEPQDFDGRRIEKVEDGWFMLNGEKYRKAMQKLYRTEYKRVKQAEYRENGSPEPKAQTPDQPVSAIYDAYPRKVGRPKALAAIEKAVKEFGYEHVLEKTKSYAQARVGQSDQFTPNPQTFFHQHRFNDDPATWKDREQTKPKPRPEANQIQEDDIYSKVPSL